VILLFVNADFCINDNFIIMTVRTLFVGGTWSAGEAFSPPLIHFFTVVR